MPETARITHALAHTLRAHPAMLLIDRLLERLFPWKPMMLVCLRGAGINMEEWSSGGKMADQGRSLVPPAGPEEMYIRVREAVTCKLSTTVVPRLLRFSFCDCATQILRYSALRCQ